MSIGNRFSQWAVFHSFRNKLPEFVTINFPYFSIYFSCNKNHEYSQATLKKWPNPRPWLRPMTVKIPTWSESWKNSRGMVIKSWDPRDLPKAIFGLVTENVGLIFPMIYSHFSKRDNDQENHWVFWGTCLFSDKAIFRENLGASLVFSDVGETPF